VTRAWSLADQPANIAVIFGDQAMTYAELDARANRVANLLSSRGIGAGDKVALSCPNVPYFVEIFWGVAKCGAELVAVDIGHSAEEIAERVAGCRAYFAFEALGPTAIGEIAWAARDPAAEFFLITLDTGFPEPLEPPEFYHPLIAQQSPDFAGAATPSVAPAVAADPDGRWLLLVPLADPTQSPVLVEAAAAGAAVVLLPVVSDRLIAEVRARVRLTREIR
jgi:acyl-CoA synthetase (AMP-forming)/AMP-acid ligase II